MHQAWPSLIFFNAETSIKWSHFTQRTAFLALWVSRRERSLPIALWPFDSYAEQEATSFICCVKSLIEHPSELQALKLQPHALHSEQKLLRGNSWEVQTGGEMRKKTSISEAAILCLKMSNTSPNLGSIPEWLRQNVRRFGSWYTLAVNVLLCRTVLQYQDLLRIKEMIHSGLPACSQMKT